METSGKSKQSKKGRNKRLTNNRGRGDVFIKKTPVCLVRNKSADLNREMEQTAKSEKSVEPEPVSEKPQVTLTTEESQLHVNSEEQQVAVAPKKPHIDVTPNEPQVAMIPKESPVAVVSDKAQMDVTPNEPQVAVIPKESLVAVVSDKAQMDVTPKEPQVAVIPKESLVAVVSDNPQMDVTPNQQQDSGIPAEVQKYFEELCNANGSRKVTFVNGLVGLPTLSEKPQVTLTTEESQLHVNSEEQQVAVAPEKPHIDVTPNEPQVAMIPKELPVAVVSDKAQMDVTPKEPQVAVIPKESLVAVVSDNPQMDVTPNQQQDSGIPAEVQKYFEELCNANGSRKVTFVNGLVGLPLPTLSEKPQVTLTTEESQLHVNSEEQQVAVAPEKPHIDVTPNEPQVAMIPKESPVAVVSDKAQMDVTPKEPQVAVIPKESLVAVVSDNPQMDMTPNQQQDSGIPAEVQKYFEELCNANGSRKVTFVNGLVGLPTPLLKAARKQYLDSQLAPPPRVNPWTARAAMLQKNCSKTNETDVPLLSSQIPQPAITSQSSRVAARPKKTVVPKKVHKQPQPPKENPWLKSTKTKETIHSLEIDEIDFPLLTAEKCVVVAPEKTQQAAKALNIKKITGSKHRRPHTGHYRLCTLWRTGSQLAVIPEESELDVIVDDISTHVPRAQQYPTAGSNIRSHQSS
ncbi:hypothetical protein D5F01_LYC02108 [Larimichthys crocea]|uniref:Uncharacterized protein n=1 Tax=Larimichthys crocea TaxID=215358 RepID=A0A6G0J7E4_LARCR|nr:hypothetical protein D5F01_LYC02108 [Larimichthys crocea]